MAKQGFILNNGVRVTPEGFQEDTTINAYPDIDSNYQAYGGQNTNTLWHGLETALENGNDLKIDVAAQALKNFSPEGNTPLIVEYEQQVPRSWSKMFNDAVHGREPETQTIRAELDESLMQKLESGQIKNAFLINEDYENYTGAAFNNGPAMIMIENGKVTDMRDGYEDAIPITVIDFAKDQAEKLGINLTVQAYGEYTPKAAMADEGTNLYRLLDDNGTPVILDIEIDNTMQITDGRYADGRGLVIENMPGNEKDGFSRTHPDNPVITNAVNEKPDIPEIKLFSYGFPLEPSDTQLSKAMVSEIDGEVLAAQNMMRIYDEMNPNIKLDFGENQMSLTEATNLAGTFVDVVTPPPGMDGQFGPMTERAVIQVQQALGLEATGVIDQSFLDALDKQMIEMQKAEYAGQRVDFVSPDGSVDKQIPSENGQTYTIPTNNPEI